MIKRVFIVMFLLAYFIICRAQLQANFSIDKASGCSPLEVHFTNNTTGATASVSYSWDFGNGNSSTLVNPGATYSAENVYIVTLTADDGGIKSTISKTITVYKKPVIDFTATPVTGCVPLNVRFTSTVSAGDGTIANYLWDFGDGTTLSSKDQSAVSHVYTVPQKPPVSLTVINSFGCYTTVDKPNLVTVLKAVQAGFTASETFLCSPGTEVEFTNSSTGGGTLSYVWDFGDGKTSTVISPNYIYSKSGTFSVKLLAKNDAGCTANAKTLIMNVGTLKANFVIPQVACVGQTLTFINTNTRPYDSVRWQVKNSNVAASGNGNLAYKFLTAGNYDIKQVAYYKNCTDVVTKTITIGAPPILNGFLATTDSSCSLPVTFKFTDTTSNVVKWQWRNVNNSQVFDTNRVATYMYSLAGTDRIGLTVTGPTGCTSSTVKAINFYSTDIAVGIKKSSTPVPSANRGCPGLSVTFSTTPLNEVVSFAWNLGDGTTSTNAEPSMVYDNPGSYAVTLDYVTKTGCRGTARFDSIYVTNIAPFDFTVSPDTVICGNSPVTFTPTVSLPNRDYVWLIDGKKVMYSLTPDPFVHHFQKTGVYTISLIMQSGTCRDTVTKVNYIRVLPPFPNIKSATNTCADTRGMVTFTDATQDNTNWSWNFGDGNTIDYGSFKPTINHTYTQTGNYKVKLTATNGNCIISDSVIVYVLLKQKPLLVADVTTICTSDSPFISLSGYETHPFSASAQPYKILKLQFGDLTTSNAVVDTGWWNNSFGSVVKGLETDKQDLRIVTTSNYFNCQDTSNFIPLKITGPIAGISFKPFKCFKQALVLNDSSRAGMGAPIVKWEWFFGDNTSIVASDGNSVSHQYKTPGDFQLKLRVTDATGCSYETPSDSAHTIRLTGPAADFAASSTDVLVNTTVFFTNTSTFFVNSELLWKFSDGSVSTANNPSFLFEKEGNQKVLLITKNLASGCTDTAQKIIEVKRVQSLFTYDVSYTNVNNCPPVIVNFKSESINADRVRWVFGDGGEAGNQQAVSHVYTNAGQFKVVLYGYDAAGRMDSLAQVIEVKGPYATLKADTLYACNALEVKLSADTVNATSFTWDFGDGTLTTTMDTFATHIYTSPGVYIPSLLMVDSAGCIASSQMTGKIIIDSVSISIASSPVSVICDSSRVTFASNVYSLSNEKLGTTLKYQWSSGLHPGETFNAKSAVYNFNKIGLHDVRLQVISPYGCKVEQIKQVDVKPGVQAGISAPSLVCINDNVFFKGNSTPVANDLQWKWELGNNVIADVQNPPVIAYANVGIQPITLVVSNGFCQDTARFKVDVRDKPHLTISASKPYLCTGDTALLVASGGNTITWAPAVFSLINGGYTAIVKPTNNITYTASIIDSVGCTAKDSVEMKVVKPFKLAAKSPIFTCLGTPVQLSANGAAIYQWTANGFNATSPNPLILPLASGIYKVVGYDGFNCFSDSANVIVTVGALPTINAGPDKRSIAGQEITLTTTSSADVIKYNWQPGQYLQCTNCASPLAKPETDINYLVTVTNNVGCTASDTIRIEMICGKELVYIPSGFTPNGDNLNDRFAIRGSGIHIKKVAVFDRWGKMVFERKDIDPRDRNSSWDGTYKGEPLGSNSYVYLLEVICNSGESFTYKGTITLVR